MAWKPRTENQEMEDEKMDDIEKGMKSVREATSVVPLTMTTTNNLNEERNELVAFEERKELVGLPEREILKPETICCTIKTSGCTFVPFSKPSIIHHLSS